MMDQIIVNLFLLGTGAVAGWVFAQWQNSKWVDVIENALKELMKDVEVQNKRIKEIQEKARHENH